MSEKVESWVEKKLDEGVEPERLKQILRKNDQDPSIVEDVQSPFEGDTEVDDDDFEFSYASESEEEAYQQESDQEDQETGSSFSMPNLSLPSVSIPSLASKKFLAVFSLVIVLAAGIGAFQYFELDQRVNKVLEPEPQCVPIKVYSVTSSNGVTTADARTYEEAKAVLEVISDGETIGSTSKVMDGREDISVDKVGDRISFHGINCDDPSIERAY